MAMTRMEPDPSMNSLSGAVIDGAIEVHRALGPGYLEAVYEEALGIELGLRGIPFERQKPIAVSYKGHAVGESRLDMLVGGRLILELKAVDASPASPRFPLSSRVTLPSLSSLRPLRPRGSPCPRA